MQQADLFFQHIYECNKNIRLRNISLNPYHLQEIVLQYHLE